MTATPVAVWLDEQDDFCILHGDGDTSWWQPWDDVLAVLVESGVTADEPTPENRLSLCRPLPKPPPLVEGWVNLYPAAVGKWGNIHSTRESAHRLGGDDFIALVHWWTDDDGDHAEVIRPEVTA